MATGSVLDITTETEGDTTVAIPAGRIDGSTASPLPGVPAEAHRGR